MSPDERLELLDALDELQLRFPGMGLVRRSWWSMSNAELSGFARGVAVAFAHLVGGRWPELAAVERFRAAVGFGCEEASVVASVPPPALMLIPGGKR